jgi:hypothetical protein
LAWFLQRAPCREARSIGEHLHEGRCLGQP